MDEVIIMENLNIKQMLEENPYLKKISEYTLFISNSDLEKIKEGEEIEVDGKNISVEILYKILTDNDYFSYASKYFNGEQKAFYVSALYNGDTIGNISYSKIEIVKGLELLIQNNYFWLNSEEKQRFANLKKGVSFNSFFNQNRNKAFDVDIEGKKYSVPMDNIIWLMTLSKEDFEKLCNNDDIKEINGMPKKYFIYASFRYFRNSGVFHDFILPGIIEERYEEIKRNQIIDLQAINQYLKTEDSLYEQVSVNEELKKAILLEMPKDLSKLEKAIYIYIKMCKTLTYDVEYFSVNQKGPATLKHKDINYVNTITPANNSVVCFEFNLIYSKLLNELGINFSSDYRNLITETYGEAHANLTFRCDKFIVKEDSVTSVLQGDLMQAKLNQPLKGLKCRNNNTKTYKEFNEYVSKIYNLIAKQEKNAKASVEHVETFDEIMLEYLKLTKNVEEVGIYEKLSILVDKVNQTKMVGIDSLSYVLQLRKVLFDAVERSEKVSVTIIRNNDVSDSDKLAFAYAIFAINLDSFYENEEKTNYYYYVPNKMLSEITKEDLQSKFNNGTFEYVDVNSPSIPGIEERRTLK